MEKMRKQIPGHSQYEITEDGEVFRMSGWIRRPRHADGKINSHIHMVRGKNDPSNAYAYATVTKDYIDESGELTSTYGVTPVGVHRLVAMAFIGPPPKGAWINHKDGNKLNNHFSNLEWTSPTENIRHAYDTGLKKALKGELSHRYGAKASPETRSLLSKKKVGENHPKFKGWYSKGGETYDSANWAALMTNSSPESIRKWANTNTKGWRFIPKEATNPSK